MHSKHQLVHFMFRIKIRQPVMFIFPYIGGAGFQLIRVEFGNAEPTHSISDPDQVRVSTHQQ